MCPPIPREAPVTSIRCAGAMVVMSVVAMSILPLDRWNQRYPLLAAAERTSFQTRFWGGACCEAGICARHTGHEPTIRDLIEE